MFDMSKDFTSGHTDSHSGSSPGAENRTATACWVLKLHNPITRSAVDNFHVKRSPLAQKGLDKTV